jgi:hypothetical protein
MTLSGQELEARRKRRETNGADHRGYLAMEEIADTLVNIQSELAALRLAVQAIVRSGGRSSSFGG